MINHVNISLLIVLIDIWIGSIGMLGIRFITTILKKGQQKDPLHDIKWKMKPDTSSIKLCVTHIT